VTLCLELESQDTTVLMIRDDYWLPIPPTLGMGFYVEQSNPEDHFTRVTDVRVFRDGAIQVWIEPVRTDDLNAEVNARLDRGWEIIQGGVIRE